MPLLVFRLFKWTVYGLLALNTYFFLLAEGKMVAFIDSAAWIVVLGVMEYESSSLGERYSGPLEKIVLICLNVFAYSMILYAVYGYVEAAAWLDVINATTWLGVCAVLLYQMYVPGDYRGAEYHIIAGFKSLLYLILFGCALIWTFQEDSLLDTFDAWLWLTCFAVVELNIFGYENKAEIAGAPKET